MEDIKTLVESLTSKDIEYACKCYQILLEESKKDDRVYSYYDDLVNLIRYENSYICTRGLSLIAMNEKWDTENKIDRIIDEYLRHITDDKPITSRKCIEVLPIIYQNKNHLKDKILVALKNADLSKYKDSMEPLIRKDINNTIKIIEGELL